MRRITQTVAAAILVGLVVAGQAAAASLGGFGARPAHFDPRVPATRAYFIRTVARGATFGDQVIVFNNSPEPMPLLVYPVDGLTGATSGVVYGNRGDRLAAAGTWITSARSTVLVPAHGQLRVPFTARAPGNATAGVHLAGLALEQRYQRASGGRFSVTEVLRTVVGIELRIPGPSAPQLRLTSIAPVAATGAGPGFTVGLVNAGAGLCKPALELALTGAGGHGTVVRSLDTVLPGDPIAYPFPWPRTIAAGRYTETVTARACGRPVTLRALATIGHPLTRPAPSPLRTVTPVLATRTTNATAWWLIVLVGAGGVSLGALLSRGRGRVRPQH